MKNESIENELAALLTTATHKQVTFREFADWVIERQALISSTVLELCLAAQSDNKRDAMKAIFAEVVRLQFRLCDEIGVSPSNDERQMVADFDEAWNVVREKRRLYKKGAGIDGH